MAREVNSVWAEWREERWSGLPDCRERTVADEKRVSVNRPPPEDPWFNFFGQDDDEDEATQETARPPPGADRPASPLTRRLSRQARVGQLGGAAAGVIFLVVLIVSVVGGGGAAAADRVYLNRLAKPALDSQAVGSTFRSLLSGPLSSYSDLESRLSELLRREQQDVSQAGAISPSPRLRSNFENAILALQLRVSGLSGFQAALRLAAAGSSKTDRASVMFAAVARLATSDVIWQDLFAKPSQAQLVSDGARNTAIPQSRFLDNLDLLSLPAMTSVLNKLRPAAPTAGATTSAGLLKAGDTGPAVTAWQVQLNKWLSRQPGNAKLIVTGTFDQATTNATTGFQNAESLTADGVVGQATRAALTKVVRGP